MLIKVKTLTGKEIELDIEPNDRVDRIKEKVCSVFLAFESPSLKSFDYATFRSRMCLIHHF